MAEDRSSGNDSGNDNDTDNTNGGEQQVGIPNGDNDMSRAEKPEAVVDAKVDAKSDDIKDAGVAEAPQNGSPFLAEPIKKPSRATALLALLIALLAAALAGFLGWQWYVTQDVDRQYQQRVDEHQKQLSQLRTSLEQLDSTRRQQLASRDQQIGALERNVQDAEQKIDAYARRLQTLTATTTDDWKLAEVEYLLGLANQRILTSKDASTAVNLLDAADAIVLELADPRLFELRKTLAADRAALRAVGEQDIDGAFLELAALSQQVSSLQVLVMPTFTAQADATTEDVDANAERPAWLQKFLSMGATTWRELKALVVVQRVDQPVEPLLPPQEQFYLKSNLRLLLGQAQLALLDGRQQVYNSSIQTASQWVASYFPQQFAANKAMHDALVALESMVVSQDYPDASRSLLAVRAFIAEQHRLPANARQAASEKEVTH